MKNQIVQCAAQLCPISGCCCLSGHLCQKHYRKYRGDGERKWLFSSLLFWRELRKLIPSGRRVNIGPGLGIQSSCVCWPHCQLAALLDLQFNGLSKGQRESSAFCESRVTDIPCDDPSDCITERVKWAVLRLWISLQRAILCAWVQATQEKGGGIKVWEWAYVNWQCWHHPRDEGRTLSMHQEFPLKSLWMSDLLLQLLLLIKHQQPSVIR